MPQSRILHTGVSSSYSMSGCHSFQVQLARAKENLDKCMSERDSHIAGELREKEAFKRVQRQLRESKDEQAELLKLEQEALQKKHDLVKCNALYQNTLSNCSY